MFVEAFTTNADGSQELLLRVILENGVMDMSEVPEKLQTTWEKFGIPIAPGKRVMPSDGEKFLQAIARDYNGSMCRSNDVIGE